MFFDMLKYVYSESVFNTLYTDIKHKSLKNPLDSLALKHHNSYVKETNLK